MSLTPYTETLAQGATADGTTETYDVETRGRRGLILVSDVTAIGNGHSFVQSAAVTLPLVVVAATNDQFKFNTNDFTIAPGTYTTLAALATAINASTKTGPVAFSTLVTVTANGTGLRFTNVASGVHAEAFAAGTHNVLGSLGLTAAWTIAQTQAAGADAAYSQTITVQGKDPASGKYFDLLASAAQATVSTVVLQVQPAMAAVSNLVANAQLPATVRVSITHTTNNVITRTIGIQLVA